MAVTAVRPLKGAHTSINTGGVPVVAVYGGIAGGRIYNPADAVDQGIAVVETLFISLVGPAGTVESATTFPIQPGGDFILPAGLDRDVSVNALTACHKFTAFIWQPPPQPPEPVPGNFPPAKSQWLQKAIPSYLYEQYADDDDLQAWVRAYNEQTQEYVDWFNTVNLPIYTGLSGTLLDWVALGLYGIQRPALSSGRTQDIGPYNTAVYNLLEYNQAKRVGANNVTVTTDDLFKRIMTWRLYRGDGNVFNLKWLKRRIIRFLTYPNGTSGNIAETYAVSVTFGSGNQINIVLPPVLNASILKEAIDSGAVELPFQFTYSVTVAS